MFHLTLLVANASPYNAPYLHFYLSPASKIAPRCTFSQNKQTSNLSLTHSLMSTLVSTISWLLPAQSPRSLPCQAKPVHAAKARITPPSSNHAWPFFTAKPSSYYVLSTLWMTPPNSPCPTLSADAEPAHQRIVQLNVTNMQYKYVLPKTKKQDLELLLDQNDFFCWKKCCQVIMQQTLS